MRRFAEAYPDFPFLQVPLAKMENIPIGQVALDQFKEDDKGFAQVPLAQITWYHHISLLSKVKDIAERAYYIPSKGAVHFFPAQFAIINPPE